MKKLVYILVALAFVACEADFSINSNRATLSNLSVECISETTISNNTTTNNEPFTSHTYLCKGVVEGVSGMFSIKVLHDVHVLYDNQYYIGNGEKMPFEFTFAPEWAYLDNPINDFIIEISNDEDEVLCQTTLVVTKHPESQTAEPADVPYMEYTLSGTSCEWSFTKEDSDVIIVNSDEELQRYIVSEPDELFPSVDFSKYTMIIAHGATPRGIYTTTVESLQQISDTEYALNIRVIMTMTDAPELWTKALLVDKWNKLYTVNLNVDIQELIN